MNNTNNVRETLICRLVNSNQTATSDIVDDFVEEWHSDVKWRNIGLHEAIGISLEDYFKYILVQGAMVRFLNDKIQTFVKVN